ncbi:MAG: hypothetical protein RQ847_03805 [Wenzhouxiangellaceae bacterium]|nr:hypothetical protein [Wenzhouxiangellaceae bacterium]
MFMIALRFFERFFSKYHKVTAGHIKPDPFSTLHTMRGWRPLPTRNSTACEANRSCDGARPARFEFDFGGGRFDGSGRMEQVDSGA